jgi:hypothetical protein
VFIYLSDNITKFTTGTGESQIYFLIQWLKGKDGNRQLILLPFSLIFAVKWKSQSP